MYSSLYSKLRFLKNPKLGEETTFLQKTQWFKREEILDIQRKRLRSLIKHAYENVPYYHALFKERDLRPEDIKTVEDLNKLPTLTKNDIRNNSSDIIAKNFLRSQMISYSTGGTTGEPLQFCVTKEYENAAYAAELRAYGWAGYKLGDKYALLWGSPRDIRELEKLRSKIENFFARCVILDAFEMSKESMRTFAYRLKEFKPKIIRGYTSPVYLFAKYLLLEGIDSIRPNAVITAAETLFDHERQTIQEAFNCEVYDFYGAREAATLSSECSEHSGYHINAENYVLEFLKEGEYAAPGETGIILVTNLRNYVMPFIRYEIGDLGKPSDEACPCGRGLPLMKSIEGRTIDFLVASDGRLIFGGPILIFKDLPVNQFQVVQETREKVIIKIVIGRTYSEEVTGYVLNEMHKYLGKKMRIDIEIVDSIPPTKSGKRRHVISKVPIKL